MSSNVDKHSTLNVDPTCGDLCMQLGNQQTCTSDNDNYIRVGPILNQIFGRCIIADLLM
jgi:hypothetical protein